MEACQFFLSFVFFSPKHCSITDNKKCCEQPTVNGLVARCTIQFLLLFLQALPVLDLVVLN